MVSFVSFSFTSALIFKISFLLLTLGFFISSFSSCFRCRVRLFIWLFSCFLRYACTAMNFPLRTAFTVSHRFWVVVFYFHSFLCKFWFLFWFLLWFVGYSAAVVIFKYSSRETRLTLQLRQLFYEADRHRFEFWEFYCSSYGKQSACNAGEPGLIPGSGRSPGEGKGNSLQYSCLENPMDRGAW